MKIVVAFGICLVLFGVASDNRGLPALLRARERVSALSREIAHLRADNGRLKVRAEALRSDPSAIEAVARQTLGFARAGEIVVIRAR
jgi:cell division protein FtsB